MGVAGSTHCRRKDRDDHVRSPAQLRMTGQVASKRLRWTLRLRLLMILTATLCPACRQQPQVEKPSTPTPQFAATRNPSEAPSPVTAKALEMPSPIFDKPYPGTGVVILI